MTSLDWQACWFWIVDSGHELLDLMDSGGPIMWVLAGMFLLFWTLVLERYWYIRQRFPVWMNERRQQWNVICADAGNSRLPQAVRAAWISQAQEQLLTPLSVMKMLVSLFPLLGLLGTVTGMIATFDAMAVSDSGSPRAMTVGIWQAILTTLAGMVLAIAGLFSLAHLERRARRSLAKLANRLRHE